MRRLAEYAKLVAISSVYETDPVGFEDQPAFLNLVARFRPGPEPEEWLALVREAEAAAGRVRTFRNAPRTLDIDVLLIGDRVLDLPGLTVPHPRMAERAFVLVPLLELEPELADPRDGRPFREHLDAVGTAGVTRLYDGARLLK